MMSERLEKSTAQGLRTNESDLAVGLEHGYLGISQPAVPIQYKASSGQELQQEKEQHSGTAEEKYVLASATASSSGGDDDGKSEGTPLQGKFQAGVRGKQQITQYKYQISGGYPAVPIQRMAEEKEPLQGKMSGAIQRMAEEEEPLQGKMSGAIQRIAEEEEPLQGKMNGAIQRMGEEEEPLQGKMNGAIQRMSEEEEPLQGKMSGAIQRMAEEEEPLQGKMSSPIQRMAEEEEPLQGKMSGAIQRIAEEEEPLQGKMIRPIQKESSRTQTIQRQSATSAKLPNLVQSKMEGAMGADFSAVNIHTESQNATNVGALAYAQGNDVHFAPGQYDPQSSSGQELIGHELAHVVQQREGRVQPTTQAKGVPVNDDKGLEAEADDMGRKAAQMKVDDRQSSLNFSSMANGDVQYNTSKKGTNIALQMIPGSFSTQQTNQRDLQGEDPLDDHANSPQPLQSKAHQGRANKSQQEIQLSSDRGVANRFTAQAIQRKKSSTDVTPQREFEQINKSQNRTGEVFSKSANAIQNAPVQFLMNVKEFKNSTKNSERFSSRSRSQIALIDTLLEEYHAIDKSDPNKLVARQNKLGQLKASCNNYFAHKLNNPKESATTAEDLDGDRIDGISSLIKDVSLEERIISDSIKLNAAEVGGELDTNLHHGTSSAILNSFGGELLSQKELHNRGIVRRTGEGNSLSGQDTLKNEVFVGMGKGGGGASAAYARAAGKLPEYNMDLLSDAALQHEISQLENALANTPLGQSDTIMDRLTKASKGTGTNAQEVALGLGGGSFNNDVLQSELKKYRAEEALRAQTPVHARQAGSYPILFEFKNPGNVTPGSGQVKEGIGLGSVDMRGNLKRAYCPARKINEFEAVLALKFPNDNYDVLALESYDNLPKDTGNGEVMWSTFDKIKKTQTKMKVARDAQALP